MAIGLWNITLYIVVLLLPTLTRAGARTGTISCHDVAEVFAQNVGTSDSVPALPVTGEILSVCSTATQATLGESCCTEDMERNFVEVSSDYVHKLLEASNRDLTNSIKRHLDIFLDHIEHSMSRAFNATSDTLIRLYQIPKESHMPVLQILFDDFKALMDGSKISIEDSVTNFFAHLFPSVYHFVLSRQPHTSGSSQALKNFNGCLVELYDEMLPFGPSLSAFAKRIHFTFQRAAAVAKTMRVMLNTIRVVETVDIDAKCRHTFARLHFCPMCAGQARTKPCRGFCLNVMRGCLPNIMELSPSWDSLVVAFHNLQLGMLRRNNVQESLAYFNGNVSEALMKAMTDMPRIFNDVAVKCQEYAPLSQVDTDPLDHLSDTPEPLKMLPAHPNGPILSLRSDIVRFVDELDNSKGFLARLADGQCRRKDMFEQEMRSDTCWNGTTVGRYLRGVPEANIIIQAQHNSEVTVYLYPKHRLLEVKDQMIMMKRNLSFLSNQELMVGDQSYGSGDYYQPDLITDDEDFTSMLSGSGSGGFESIETHLETKTGTGGNSGTTPTGKNAGIDNTADDRWGDQKPADGGPGDLGVPVSSASTALIFCCGLLWRWLVAMTADS